MCNWRRWVWPGILATVILTALAMFFHSNTIENDLTAKAGSALEAESGWASVELDGRDLTLSGVAPTQEDADAALQTALNAYDVRVASDATTLPPIASPYPFKAIKSDDEITLTGNYPNDKVRAQIVASAETAMPGVKVTDELTLARGAPAGLVGLAGFGLSQLSNLTEGEASLSDADYSIQGLAADSATYEAELARANADIPEGGALASAEIVAPTVSPYIWSATKSDENSITLAGFAPSIEAREALAERAGEANPDATIINELQIAQGAPDAFGDMAGFGLTQLGGLTSGSASLADLEYAITGEAETSADYDAVRSAANGDLPGGTLASAAITPPAAEGAYTWSAAKGPDGTITLTGLMPTAEARERIANRAQEVNPDATINNQIAVATGAPDGFVEAAEASLGYLPRFSAGAVNLSDLDMNVQGRAIDAENFDGANSLASVLPEGVTLADDITLPAAQGAYEVVAKRFDNVVTITGFAPSTAERDQIGQAAEAFGINVVNRVEVAAGAPEGVAWGDAASAVIGGLKDASNGTAMLTAAGASVDADLAPETVGVEEATQAFSSAMVAGVNASSIEYRLPQVSPFVWKAQNTDNPSVSGYVPSKSLEQKILDEAGEIFDGAQIDNQLILASGAPRGFEAAASVGLGQISRLEGGTAEISDTTLTVTGVALTQAAKADIERKIQNGVPPGFSGRPDISVKPAPLETGGLGALTPQQCQLELNGVLTGGINFETNKADISETSLAVLDRLAYTAQQCPEAAIEIGGHTDADGSDEYNQSLSERRANAVANYIIVSGVSSSRLTAIGYGESKPIASNDTDEGKAQNRRIEFVIAQ